jgi:hypothetical protein
VSQNLLCSKVPRTTLKFFPQQMLEMSPTGLKTCLDTLLHCAIGVLSSGTRGTFPTSAVGRTETWYVVLYCTVSFGTLCIWTILISSTNTRPSLPRAVNTTLRKLVQFIQLKQRSATTLSWREVLVWVHLYHADVIITQFYPFIYTTGVISGETENLSSARSRTYRKL